jgi:LuxR family maltose regulon positive regulatory protein
VEELLADNHNTTADQKWLVAEFEVFRAVYYYFKFDFDAGLAALTRADVSLKGIFIPSGVTGFLTSMKGLLLQASGVEFSKVYTCIQVALDKAGSSSSESYRKFLMDGLCLINLVEGNIKQLLSVASKQCMDTGNDLSLVLWSRSLYFKGISYFHLDELDKAISVVEPLLSKRYIIRPLDFINAIAIQVLAFHMKGMDKNVDELLGQLTSFAEEVGTYNIINFVRGFDAYIQLYRGNVSVALRWVNTMRDDVLRFPMLNLFQLDLVVAKILLASDDQKDIEKADKLINEMYNIIIETNNNRFLMDILILQAELFLRKNDKAGAVQNLGKVVRLAMERNFLRFFIHPDDSLLKLLVSMEFDAEGFVYVGKIIQALQPVRKSGIKKTTANSGLIEPLSARELDVLNLMSENFINKEISTRLFISPGTVKRHSENIYGKLGVHNRKNAVIKARALGLI